MANNEFEEKLRKVSKQGTELRKAVGNRQGKIDLFNKKVLDALLYERNEEAMDTILEMCAVYKKAIPTELIENYGKENFTSLAQAYMLGFNTFE